MQCWATLICFTPTLVSCAIATVTILPPLYHPHATCIVIARNPKIEHNNGSHLDFLLCVSYMYTCTWVCCFALPCLCLPLLASFFLPSHLSFKNMYIYMYIYSTRQKKVSIPFKLIAV